MFGVPSDWRTRRVWGIEEKQLVPHRAQPQNGMGRYLTRRWGATMVRMRGVRLLLEHVTSQF